MLHGVGIRALPRFDWPDVVDWIRGSALPLLFIFGSAYVLIRATAMVTRNLAPLLVPAQLPLAERMDRRKRIDTRGRLLRWTVTAVVLAIAGVMALKTVGVDVPPLLAGGPVSSSAP
jgi:small-conductance mechanosensitive channel